MNDGNRSRVPALDGLRGVAVLLVMAYHFTAGFAPHTWLDHVWLAPAKLGWVGVEIFFALSGFLITGILLDAPRSAASAGRFYARRALRIFPLFYTFVLFFAYVVPLVWPGGAATLVSENLRASLGFTLTYTLNLAMAWTGSFAVAYFIPHVWTLAIEEQFYLAWPAVALGRKPQALLPACLAIAALSAAGRAIAVAAGPWQPIAIAVFTVTHADALALGAACACAVRVPAVGAVLARYCRPALVAAIAAIGLLAASERGFDQWSPVSVGAILPVAAVGSAALVFLLVSSPTSALATTLADRRLRLAGRYSYAMYLFHVPIVYILAAAKVTPDRFLTDWPTALPSALAYSLLAGGLTFTAAAISWAVLEQPLLRLRRFVPL